MVFLVSGVNGKVQQTCVTASLDWRPKRPIKEFKPQECRFQAQKAAERFQSRRREDEKCISKKKTSVNGGKCKKFEKARHNKSPPSCRVCAEGILTEFVIDLSRQNFYTTSYSFHPKKTRQGRAMIAITSKTFRQ